MLDFGLVKAIGGPEREETLGGAVGMTAGTPAYMAPEILRDEPVDGRADLVCPRVRRVLSPHGSPGVRRPRPLPDGGEAPAAGAGTALEADHQSHSPCPRADRARLPGQAPRRPTLERDGARPEARRGQRSFSCQPSSFTPWPDRAYTAWTSWVSGCPTCHPRLITISRVGIITARNIGPEPTPGEGRRSCRLRRRPRRRASAIGPGPERRSDSDWNRPPLSRRSMRLRAPACAQRGQRREDRLGRGIHVDRPIAEHGHVGRDGERERVVHAGDIEPDRQAVATAPAGWRRRCRPLGSRR